MISGRPNPTPTYRDSLRKISPPWLQTGLAERTLYVLGAHLDAFGDAIVAGVKQRFPGLYSFDSLALLGRERRIARGLYEFDAPYATRLTRWFIDHQTRGGPYALLTQLWIHYAPNSFPIDLLYYNGTRYRLAADGTITRDSVSWRPDTDAARWARWVLFFYTDLWAVTDPTPDEISDITAIPREWNAAHCFGKIVIFPGTAALVNYHPGCLTVNSTTGEPINTDSNTLVIEI